MTIEQNTATASRNDGAILIVGRIGGRLLLSRFDFGLVRFVLSLFWWSCALNQPSKDTELGMWISGVCLQNAK